MSQVQEIPGANGTSLGAVSIEVDRASPRPGDDTGGSLHVLVMRGASLGMPGSAVSSDAILAPGFSSTASPGVAVLSQLSTPAYRLEATGG
jgi:hypothetical protein